MLFISLLKLFLDGIETIVYLSFKLLVFIFMLFFEKECNRLSSKKEVLKDILFFLYKKNIFYVKLFQAFALNMKGIHTDLYNELIKYNDNVPVTNEEIDYETLNSITYKNWNKELINSGMISLVYKVSNIITGEIRILKIKRVGIESKINEGLKLMKLITFIFSYIPYIKNANLNTLIENTSDVLLQQIDFNKEIENMKRVKEIVKYMDYIVIPDVFLDEDVSKNPIVNPIVNPCVIEMTFLDGMNIKQVKQEDYKAFSKNIIKFGIFTTLKGFIHGDLHNGNIIFIKNENDENENENDHCSKPKYQIGVIDFGITVEFETNVIQKLVKIILDSYVQTVNDISLENIENDEDYLVFFNNYLNINNNTSISNFVNNIKKEIFFSKNEEDFINELIVDIYRDVLCIKFLDESKGFSKFKNIIMKLYSIFDLILTKKYLLVNSDFKKIQMCIFMVQSIIYHMCPNNAFEYFDEALFEIFGFS